MTQRKNNLRDESRDEMLAKNFFVQPGYVLVPAREMQLATVVTSGIAVTLFDETKKSGGLGHYIRPLREAGLSTAMFAAPAIVSLLEMLLSRGAQKELLEAHLYGGATNPGSSRYEKGLAEKNVEIGIEVLTRLKVRLASQDTGGQRARKLIFNSGTGEFVVARVDNVREADWYPEISPLGR